MSNPTHVHAQVQTTVTQCAHSPQKYESTSERQNKAQHESDQGGKDNDNYDATEMEIQRRLAPKCEDDLKLLHSELSLWKQQRSSAIANESSDETRRSKSLNLLSQESKLIRHLSISHKGIIVQNRIDKVKQLLKKSACPRLLTFTHTSGHRIHVASNDSLNAEKLLFLFEKMEEADIQSVSDRRSSLKSLESFLTKFECSKSKEIVELVNREIDMLQRGTDAALGLPGLRQRLFNLFIQFVESFTATRTIHNER